MALVHTQVISYLHYQGAIVSTYLWCAYAGKSPCHQTYWCTVHGRRKSTTV